MNSDPHSGLLRLANLSLEEMEASLALTSRTDNRIGEPPSVALWILPAVSHALKGGVRTVFMIAEHLSRTHGTHNHFVIVVYGKSLPDCSALEESLASHFPHLQFTLQGLRALSADVNRLPASDLAICTLWTTAYVLARYNRTRAKFYLVQDHEPMFYDAGALYAAIEHTYRLGFAHLANTQGVAEKLKPFSDDLTMFTPGVDRSLFYPDPQKSSLGRTRRLVFYGRPANTRNCFHLGIQTLLRVKRSLGADVEIFSVGADWDEADYGVEGAVKNLGLLDSMDEVAALYRSADLGLVFMVTPHPSYQPLEYMASGCVVATNRNESNEWLVNDNTSLLLDPLPTVAADQIVSLLAEPTRWEQLRAEGLRQVETMTWKTALGRIEERLLA